MRARVVFHRGGNPRCWPLTRIRRATFYSGLQRVWGWWRLELIVEREAWQNAQTLTGLEALVRGYRSVGLSFDPGTRPWGIVASVTNGHDGRPRMNTARGAMLAQVVSAAVVAMEADPALAREVAP